MHRTPAITIAALMCVATTTAPSIAGAQMRRSGGTGEGAPAGEMPKGTPRDARRPYAGVWDGSVQLKGGPGGDHDEIPIVMVVGVADSAKGDYVAATILPNGARAPLSKREW